MDKRKIKQKLKKIKALKIWQLLILLVLTIFVAATSLRMNNVEMIRRRNAVIAADKELNLEKALVEMKKLHNFVNSHMNASTTVQLEKIYNAENDKIIQAAAEKEKSSENGIQVTQKAREACDSRFSRIGYGRAYSECFVSELSKYNQENASLNTNIKFPDAELYIKHFESPVWTPDLAGWTIIVSSIIVFLISLKIAATLVLNLLLKKHKPFI